jgi:hypothetical protein
MLLNQLFYLFTQSVVGFRVLKEGCPEWLSWGILASIVASFGFKSIS